MEENKELTEYVEYLNKRYANKYVKIINKNDPKHVSYQYITEFVEDIQGRNKINIFNKWIAVFYGDNTMSFDSFNIGYIYTLSELKEEKLWNFQIMTADECENILKKEIEKLKLFEN